MTISSDFRSETIKTVGACSRVCRWGVWIDVFTRRNDSFGYCFSISRATHGILDRAFLWTCRYFLHLTQFGLGQETAVCVGRISLVRSRSQKKPTVIKISTATTFNGENKLILESRNGIGSPKNICIDYIFVVHASHLAS